MAEKPTITKAKDSFRFYTRLNLTELTGLRASNIAELLGGLKTVPGSCIYHHTHRFLQQHQFLSPEPPNDFAYWVSAILGDDELGERLASIDTVQFASLRELRENLIATIESYLKTHTSVQMRFAGESQEFHFIKSLSFVLPTPHEVHDLAEFCEVLKKITIDSIYFHIFEARLRLEKKTNDFSHWIETSIGDKSLADQIARVDPYTCTLEDLRATLIKAIERRLKGAK
ncbi:MAG: DUF5752 family protein [Candidatus Omnitrophota bacterium]